MRRVCRIGAGERFGRAAIVAVAEVFKDRPGHFLFSLTLRKEIEGRMGRRGRIGKRGPHGRCGDKFFCGA